MPTVTTTITSAAASGVVTTQTTTEATPPPDAGPGDAGEVADEGALVRCKCGEVE